MTDLEITKLCAEAMGYEFHETETSFDLGATYVPTIEVDGELYDPLQDDAQAMELVKKFNIAIGELSWDENQWKVKIDDMEWHDPDLNRSICECVAKMQSKTC